MTMNAKEWYDRLPEFVEDSEVESLGDWATGDLPDEFCLYLVGNTDDMDLIERWCGSAVKMIDAWVDMKHLEYELGDPHSSEIAPADEIGPGMFWAVSENCADVLPSDVYPVIDRETMTVIAEVVAGKPVSA